MIGLRSSSKIMLGMYGVSQNHVDSSVEKCVIQNYVYSSMGEMGEMKLS